MEDLKAHWKVEGGELVNDGHGVYLTTDDPYGDIELYVDYKMLPLGDSGIYLRSPTPQVQIWDYTNEKVIKLGTDKGSGGLWNNTGRQTRQRPAREGRQGVRRVETRSAFDKSALARPFGSTANSSSTTRR